MEVLLKYSISGDFVDQRDYEIVFNMSKMSPIWTIDQVPEDIYPLLQSFDGQLIKMTYRGVSKVDSVSLFVVNIKENLRNLKLFKVLNF